VSPPESTPEAFCNALLTLSSKERHERLKALDANEMFCSVMPLLPERLRDEFWWLEKCEYVEANLKRRVTDIELERLIAQKIEGLGPTCLKSLLESQSNVDELWLFEDFPGDKGYALLRQGSVVAFSITEITTVTFE
jgi:hypothetical protein